MPERRLDIDALKRVLGARLGVAPEGPSGLAAASGAAFHSVRVRPGDAFFALPGASEHGIAYADEAIARGASYVVSDRPHPRGVRVPDPAAALLALGAEARAVRGGPVVGITGSAGKTTCKDLVAAAVAGHKSHGNLNTTLALASTLVDAWLEDGGERPLVLELGIDHRGEADAVTALVQPTHAVLTLIAPAHLDGIGDLSAVAREKSRILAAGTERRYAAAGTLRHLDDELAAGCVVYGLDRDVPPTGSYRATADGGLLEARLDEGETVSLALPGLGRALAEHALLALLVAHDLGVERATAAERIAAAAIEPRRLQPHALDGLLLIDDSYNANPASMALALEVLAELPRPHAAVLGDMLELADEAERHHRELGERTRGLDLVWAVGAHAEAIAAGNRAVRTYPDAAAAEADRSTLPHAGTLLVKGSRGIALDRLVDTLVRERRPRSAEGVA